MFSCEYWEIFKNAHFEKYLRTAGSELVESEYSFQTTINVMWEWIYSKQILMINKVNEFRYIALFVVSVFIKMLFSICWVNIYFLNQ